MLYILFTIRTKRLIAISSGPNRLNWFFEIYSFKLPFFKRDDHSLPLASLTMRVNKFFGKPATLRVWIFCFPFRFCFYGCITAIDFFILFFRAHIPRIYCRFSIGHIYSLCSFDFSCRRNAVLLIQQSHFLKRAQYNRLAQDGYLGGLCILADLCYIRTLLNSKNKTT